jgi:folylpolyglutamate synthase
LKGKLDEVKFIHVAGTKGKGTVCLYSEAILSEYKRARGVAMKIACLTSPHITDVRERIRLNGSNISKDLFTKYVYRLWNEMQHHYSRSHNTGTHIPTIPGYPGFLVLLAFYIFLCEKVDVAVVETGIGGERDSTNVIRRPSATGITSLGLDHIDVLGNDIGSIAWHKGGIFKSGAPAFTVPQDETAIEILRKRALEKHVPGKLQVVAEDVVERYGIEVYPNLPYQRFNASLAVNLVEATLKDIDKTFIMTSSLARSVERADLQGRNEILSGRKNTWLLNTAHNTMSVKQACIWFSETLSLQQE